MSSQKMSAVVASGLSVLVQLDFQGRLFFIQLEKIGPETTRWRLMRRFLVNIVNVDHEQPENVGGCRQRAVVAGSARFSVAALFFQLEKIGPRLGQMAADALFSRQYC